MRLLDGWYPGFGEVEKIRRMSPFARQFIYCASKENPDFLENYLLPVLDGSDSEGELMCDIQKALYSAECEASGLGGYGFDGSWLRNVPETLGALRVDLKYKDFAKERKEAMAPAKAAFIREKKEYAAARKSKDAEAIARERAELAQAKADVAASRHIFEKQKLTKADKQALKAQIGTAKKGTHWAVFRDTRTGDLVATQAKTMKSGNFFDSAGRTISKGWQKYGNIAITVVGAALAPFTGGASLAAAALITAGNTMYQKKRAADKAKQAGHRDAAKLKKEAAKAEADTTRQVDDFYTQNQQWFVDNLGVTPDKWAALTLEQKIGLLNSGTTGRPPVDPGQAGAGGAAPGGGYGTPSGGGGGDYQTPQPGAAPDGTKVATAGMFDGAMLPMLAAGVALAIVFGKPVKGGGRRRTKRNPRRRRWSA